MDSLSVSNEQLQQMLAKHQTGINTALTAYLNNVQAHLIQDLSELKSQTETLIEDYTKHIAQLIEQREDRIAQVIKSEMKKWAIVTSLFTLSTLVLGMMIGAVLVNKFSKPIYIQQPISYAQPNYAQR